MSDPLPEFKVTIEKMDEATREFIADGYPDDLGLRAKCGGTPDWEHNDHDVHCPECQKEIAFVGHCTEGQWGKLTVGVNYATQLYRVDRDASSTEWKDLPKEKKASRFKGWNFGGILGRQSVEESVSGR